MVISSKGKNYIQHRISGNAGENVNLNELNINKPTKSNGIQRAARDKAKGILFDRSVQKWRAASGRTKRT